MPANGAKDDRRVQVTGMIGAEDGWAGEAVEVLDSTDLGGADEAGQGHQQGPLGEGPGHPCGQAQGPAGTGGLSSAPATDRQM